MRPLASPSLRRRCFDAIWTCEMVMLKRPCQFVKQRPKNAAALRPPQNHHHMRHFESLTKSCPCRHLGTRARCSILLKPKPQEIRRASKILQCWRAERMRQLRETSLRERLRVGVNSRISIVICRIILMIPVSLLFSNFLTLTA